MVGVGVGWEPAGRLRRESDQGETRFLTLDEKNVLKEIELKYLLSSEVDIQPSLEQFIGHQGYTELW